MKKRTKYMSDETFSELKESLEQALQHARGERNDLRVTVVAAPPRAGSASAGASIKALIEREIENLSETKLRQVAEFIVFLKFRENVVFFTPNGEGANADEPKPRLMREEAPAIVS